MRREVRRFINYKHILYNPAYNEIITYFFVNTVYIIAQKSSKIFSDKNSANFFLSNALMVLFIV